VIIDGELIGAQVYMCKHRASSWCLRATAQGVVMASSHRQPSFIRCDGCLDVLEVCGVIQSPIVEPLRQTHPAESTELNAEMAAKEVFGGRLRRNKFI
jgi:hypothetical protein